jgi:ATP-dependent Lon protease
MPDLPDGIDITNADNKMPDFPELIGVLMREDLIIFPLMIAQLQIREAATTRLIDEALSTHRMIGVLSSPTPEGDEPVFPQLPRIGSAAVIHKMLKLPDGTVNILIQGISRINFLEFTQTTPHIIARVERLESETDESVETQALAHNVADLFQRLIGLVPHFPDEWKGVVQSMSRNADHLADFVASNMNTTNESRQKLLETLSVKDRLSDLTMLLNNELQVVELSNKIQGQVQSEMSKNQREFFLRKQMDTIRQELGEDDEQAVEINELRKRLDEANLPQQAKEAAERELDRLRRMPPAAAEHTVARTYLDWLLSFPWSVSTQDNLDIHAARKILEADHYGLAKIKDRILEYLAVRKLKADMKGPIICFVGPPGVGKTSLGQSIAHALGRKFVRLSLGGIRDEAEIRGHRRTYIGALPGRIVQGLRRAGSNNPVFMLDEVDKIGQDFRGDPSSALLEVLDPEQNAAFSDHYLEVDVDLSKVMFVTTANQLSPIPPPLRDRMEILELPGYTEEEKVQIAKRHLIPRQRDAHGLTAEQIPFNLPAFRTIISGYTREAGVRNLEREMAHICRKVARKIAEGEGGPFPIGPKEVSAYLGTARFDAETAERMLDIGVVTGLAATTVGGDIIFVEATKMSGSGKLILTGQLGDVMRESAQAALSYIQSQQKKYHLEKVDFSKTDIHIHVPAGATPKEGPSAGVTLITALVSLLTERRTHSDVAMTGEITLRGKVMPIGGVKEKTLAAQRAGIRTVILPSRNKRDLEDIPETVRNKVTFVFADHVDDVLKVALEPAKKGKAAEKAEKDA